MLARRKKEETGKAPRSERGATKKEVVLIEIALISTYLVSMYCRVRQRIFLPRGADEHCRGERERRGRGPGAGSGRARRRRRRRRRRPLRRRPGKRCILLSRLALNAVAALILAEHRPPAPARGNPPSRPTATPLPALRCSFPWKLKGGATVKKEQRRGGREGGILRANHFLQLNCQFTPPCQLASLQTFTSLSRPR